MPSTRVSDVAIAYKTAQAGWRKFLFAEIVTSAFANTMFSIAFVFLVFYGHAHIPVRGSGGLIFDAIPQSFMVALMGTLMSPLISRKRISQNKLPGCIANRLTRNSQVVLRAFLFALAAMIAGVAIQAVLLPIVFPETLEFKVVLLYKSLYGACLAIVITPFALFSAFKFVPTQEPGV